ncbi:MAG: hypothetical protein JXR97_16200 [Planctomycetes bacterium]|nr:hypothetical protein [Planctomycetota bacterium]
MNRFVLLGLIVIIGGAIVGIFSWLFNKKDSKPKSDASLHEVEIEGNKLVLVPSSQSQARADSVLPNKGSEDASSIISPLVSEEKSASIAPDADEPINYLPNERSSWVVYVEFEGNPHLDVKAVANVFDKEWRKTYGGMTIYGLTPDSGSWTFLISRDGPKVVTKIQLAFDYYQSWNEEAQLATEKDYELRLKGIEEAAKALGKPIMCPSKNPKEAASFGLKLKDIHESFDKEAILVLSAPQGKSFDGKQVWDVMLSLGLRWGDMDLFHCQNLGKEGDDSFFSVWTTTQPGYFIPEHIAEDKVHVENLVFGFSIPRCFDPVKTFSVMSEVAEYSKKRLGGTILDANDKPVNMDSIKKDIQKTVDSLKEQGFDPGSGDALRLF